MQWAESKWASKGDCDEKDLKMGLAKRKLHLMAVKRRRKTLEAVNRCFIFVDELLSTISLHSMCCAMLFLVAVTAEAQVPLKTFIIICMCLRRLLIFPFMYRSRPCHADEYISVWCRMNSINKYTRSVLMPHTTQPSSHLQLAQRWYYLIFCRFDFRFMLFSSSFYLFYFVWTESTYYWNEFWCWLASTSQRLHCQPHLPGEEEEITRVHCTHECNLIWIWCSCVLRFLSFP